MVKDRLGEKHGLLTVTSRAGSDAKGNALWQCSCACGVITLVRGFALKSTTSCGCAAGQERHGMYNTPEYRAWQHMKERCSNPKFLRYAGRGITVCSSWANSFIQFYADIGPRPSKKHSIKRIDNEKGYCRENCKWGTAHEQAKNKCSASLVTAFGITKNLIDWANLYGIDYGTLHNRIYRSQMPPEEAMTRPLVK